jgi:RHS repeat-associated protein
VEARFGGLAVSSITYDPQGRIATTTRGSGADSRTTTFAYGSDGFLQSITDPASQTTTYSRDAGSRITGLTPPGGAQARFGYDANGNLTSLTPPGRPDHLLAYAQDDQPSRYTAPIVGTQNSQTVASYDADRLPARVDRPDGQSVGLQYDTGGRLDLVDLVSGGTRFGYDGAGRLATLDRDQGADLGFTHDGVLPVDMTWSGAIAGSVTRAHDNDFRVTSLSVNGADPVAVAYDADGLLVHAGSLTLTRDAQNGLITATTLGSVTDATTYDAFGDLATYAASQGGSSVYSATYTRDALGRIATRIEFTDGITRAFAYTYDPDGRLTEVRQDGSLTARYTYDANGNRLSRTDGGGTTTATYDDQDRLIQSGASTYVHNAAGERASQTVAGQTTSFRYDGLGNLTGATLPGGTEIEYVLDGQGRRVGKRLDGTLVQGFLYQDSLRPIAELDGTGNVVSRFVHAHGINVPAYMVKAGVAYRIVTDHLGSPRLVIDVTSGDIVQRMDYDEFGRVTLDTQPGFQPFGFAGGLHDPQTDLVHFGAREYDPETGRWTTKDPIGFLGGDANLYAYVLNDPVNRIDIAGTASLYPPGHALYLYRNVVAALMRMGWTQVGAEGVLGTLLRHYTSAFVVNAPARGLLPGVVRSLGLRPPGVGFITPQGLLLNLSFVAGFAFGTWLNHTFCLSDKISDFLLDLTELDPADAHLAEQIFESHGGFSWEGLGEFMQRRRRGQ